MALIPSCVILCTDDPSSIGRVDTHSLPEQSLMELLVAHFDDTVAFHDENGEFLPVEKWRAVALGEDQRVAAIVWDMGGLFGSPRGPVRPGGSIDLRWLPAKTREFRASELQLSGSVDTAALPLLMLRLDISRNKFTGEFVIESLPPAMQQVMMFRNKLSGSLNIPALPKTMQYFMAAYNEFSGTVDLSSLPEPLVVLELNTNQLSGKVDLRILPPNLRMMHLHENLFDDCPVTVGKLPVSLKYISVSVSSENVVDTEGNTIVTSDFLGQRTISINGENFTEEN